MSEIEFVNRRFDPDLSPLHQMAKNMAQSFGYTAELSVDPNLAQLLRLRVAQINNCSYCLILHTQAARDHQIPSAVIDGLGAWRHSDLYSEPERAALAYTEGLTEGKGHGFESLHARLAQHFDEKLIAEIAAIVINMNVWTRLKLAQGATATFNHDN